MPNHIYYFRYQQQLYFTTYPKYVDILTMHNNIFAFYCFKLGLSFPPSQDPVVKSTLKWPHMKQSEWQDSGCGCHIQYISDAISLRLQGKLSFPYNCQKMNGQIYVLLC